MTDRTTDDLETLRLADLEPGDLVAPNFRFHELTRSELASRRGIDNAFPGEREMRAAVHLAREVLQRVRDAWGSFTPNSVFRGQALERALKGRPSSWVSTSQHTQGCACDIEIPGTSTLELARWAADNLPAFDQIICECYDPRKGPNSGWVHVSLRAPGQGDNRRRLLSYIRDPRTGRMTYVEGLRESVG
jgi:hypothetical protein